MGSGVSAVIAAAGSGNRMGCDKIFLKLLGKEVILYSLEALENNSLVDEIILVISATNKAEAERLCGCRFQKLKKIVTGGETRSASVIRGIDAADPTYDYLLIHDGARPLVSDRIITDCINNGKKYDAATAAVSVTDTIKTVSDNVITGTVDRNILVAVQTPQVFRKELYLEYAERLKGESFTDDCRLFELSGHRVYITKGEKTNLKLTTPCDIIAAEAYLREETEACE